MTEPVRLAKRLAAQIACSRREAEQYIEGGWVSVDGAIVEEPYRKVDDAQRVELHPDARLEKIEPATIIMHKPSGCIVSDGPDPASDLLTLDNRCPDDVHPMRLLRRHFTRLVSPLTLEAAASGLCVLSQDWQVLRKLDDDGDRIEQEFNVDVVGDIEPNGLNLLNQGLKIEGWRLPERKVSWQSEARLRFAIKAVQPGMIQAMCAAVGLEVVALKRIRVGRVSMARLQAGQWRLLGKAERF